MTFRAWRGDSASTLFQSDLGWFRDIASGRIMIYGPYPIFAITLSGDFILGTGSPYEFSIRDRAGTALRVIGRDYDQRPITEDDRRILTQMFTNSMAARGLPKAALADLQGAIDFPESYPAFTRILTDDEQRIWVQLAASADELARRGVDEFGFDQFGSSRWDIFDAQGRYQAQVQFPAAFQLTRVRGGQLYGYSANENAEPVVLRLRVEELEQ